MLPRLPDTGRLAVCGLLLAMAALPSEASGQDAARGSGNPTVVLLKSVSVAGSVGPFEETAKGFKDALSPKREVVIFPDIPAAYTADSVRLENPDVVVALGAEAARFAAAELSEYPQVVALAPGARRVESAPVSLLTSEVAPALQMRWIGGVLPDVSRVGVIYDPRASQRTVDALSAASDEVSNGRSRRLTIVPIPVESGSEVPTAFRESRNGIEALLFVPDPTVITRGTIGYLLKESLAAQMPAIGFNWYFVDNGAVLGFGIDYPALGRQTAAAARRLADTGEPSVAAPAAVIVWVNYRVAQKLRIRTDYDPDQVREIR